VARKISATEASRHFSRLLDDVEHHGAEYVVERQGLPVAKIAPAGPSGGSTWGEFLRMRRQGPQPDANFARDLKRIRRHQGKLRPG